MSDMHITTDHTRALRKRIAQLENRLVEREETEAVLVRALAERNETIAKLTTQVRRLEERGGR